MKDVTFNNLKKKIENLIMDDWINISYLNSNNLGICLEKLLNINSSFFEIPDYFDIELKTITRRNYPCFTLFNANFDSGIFEAERLYKTYGSLKGINFIARKGYMKVINNHTFYLQIDNNNKKVILVTINLLNFEKDYSFNWSFDLLEEKLQRKLKKLCVVWVDKKIIDDQTFMKVKEYHFYKLKSFLDFINLIEKGIIRVSVRIYYDENRKKYINHGISFEIYDKCIENLFEKIL